MNNKKIILISVLVFISLISLTYFAIDFVTKQDVLEGQYVSKMGVIDKVSCVCFNSGYVDNIPVCMDSDLKIDCKKVKFLGAYNFVNVDGSLGNCMLENYQVFVVNSFECLE